MSRVVRYTEAEFQRLYGRSTTPSTPKPSKYRNVRTTTEDGTFASKREAERASHLKLLEKAGHITALQYQVRFKLMATGGVYLGGGIPPRIVPALRELGFMKAFTTKGRMGGLLGNMPVHVVRKPHAGLFGAACHALAAN